MAFSLINRSTKKCIITALESGALTILDFETGSSLEGGLKLEECPMALDFDSSSMRGIVGTASRNLVIIAVAPNLSITALRVVTLQKEGVASLRIRGDKKLVAVACWDGRIRLLSWKTFVTLAVLDTHTQTVNCLAFTPHAPYIMVAGCKEGKISLWDIYNAKR